jgi:CheY-like chemotaxis protein
MARLLLVDDEPAQIKVWQLLLEARDHVVLGATTPQQAIQHLRSLQPEVLIVDLRLPELQDGLAVLRQASQFPRTKIIVISGWPQDLETLPERACAHRLLTKPVRPQALFRAIAELTARTASG